MNSGSFSQMRSSCKCPIVIKLKIIFAAYLVVRLGELYHIIHDHCFYFSLQFEAIPESLKNMLLVMSTAGIFDQEECALTARSQGDNRKTLTRSESEIHKYSALWQVTWERIDCFLPNLRQELFTPRSQSPPVNIPQVKAEQEKIVEEESSRVPDLSSTVGGEKIYLDCQKI